MARWMEDPVQGGGGAWADEGTHVVDLLRWMVLGDRGGVSAFTSKLVKTHLKVEARRPPCCSSAAARLGR